MQSNESSPRRPSQPKVVPLAESPLKTNSSVASPSFQSPIKCQTKLEIKLEGTLTIENGLSSPKRNQETINFEQQTSKGRSPARANSWIRNINDDEALTQEKSRVASSEEERIRRSEGKSTNTTRGVGESPKAIVRTSSANYSGNSKDRPKIIIPQKKVADTAKLFEDCSRSTSSSDESSSRRSSTESKESLRKSSVESGDSNSSLPPPPSRTPESLPFRIRTRPSPQVQSPSQVDVSDSQEPTSQSPTISVLHLTSTKSKEQQSIKSPEVKSPASASTRPSSKRLDSTSAEKNRTSLKRGEEGSKQLSVKFDSEPSLLAKRARVVEEILSSEKVFLGLLQDFLGCYYVALCAEREQASMDFMSRSSLVGLCSNIEQIVAVSQQLLSELTLAASSSGDMSKAELGEVFLCTSSLLKLYGQYAENHSAARHDIRATIQSPSFRAFWDRTETDAMLGRGPGTEPPRMPTTSATLDGYLILPIQRVPRYLLLLKELIKTTPPDLMKKECDSLERAIEEVGNAAKFMNECIWRAEQKEILRDLQSKFVGTVVDFIGGVGLAGYRALIHEGELVRVTSKNVHRAYHFHLMNDALVYSRANGSGGFRFHRALSLTGSCSVTESPAIASSAYEVYTNDSSLSCAFKISTPEKSFVVYAASAELKATWMSKISGAIRAQATLEAQAKEQADAASKLLSESDSNSKSTNEESATAPTLQSATDKCQMCRATLYVFTRRLNCERCGLLVCGTCGSNQRVLPGKLKSKQLRTTLPVCCACAWEMDGTAVDTSVDEFRLKLWVEDVQSLVGGVGGHAIVESAGDKRNRHLDAVEALKRLYFSVTSKHRNEERFRGPSNAGLLGQDAAFSVPIGVPSDDSLASVTLHVHMVGVGEIGRVPIRLESIVIEPEVTRAQSFHKWHVVAPNPTTTAVSTLAITLIQSTGKDGIHLRLSDKERGALRIGLKVCFELHVPPSLWGAHFLPTQRNRGPSLNGPAGSSRPRSVSVTTKRPGALKAVNQAAELQDDVALRLRRFMGLDDPAFTVGGTNVDKSETGLREKLNVSLLTEYEKKVIKNPTVWGLSLTDTLYSDCLAHYGAMAKSRASLYSDTQLTLLNRLRVFHTTPEIMAIIQKKAKTNSSSNDSPKPSGRVLERGNQDVLLQAAQRQASQQEGRRASRNIEISRKALLGQDRDKEKKKRQEANGQNSTLVEEEDEEAEEEQLDKDDREMILKQLLESEKVYLENLEVLDEVFVARLTQVAQGSDIRLATLKRTDLWAEKMGLSGATPTMTTGIQTMNTGVLGRAKSIIQRSPSKLFSKELFSRASSSSSLGGSPTKSSRNPGDRRSLGHGAADRDRDGEDEDDDVRSILKQPFVTVLMQSVKQIRTVNQEFCNSLSQRFSSKNRFSPDVCVGDILERFAGVMPVYSTYASHQPFALEELTNARTEDEGWDVRWAMGARANSKSLDALLAACEADPRCAGRTLKTFLNIPLERVETYRSALSALLMCTPRNHPDWNRMRLALGKIVESTKHMTRAVRRRENLERLREIEAMVEDWPDDFQLIEPKRWLVREGCLIERQTFAKRETHRARYFWLFSDCLVMATKISRGGTLHRLKSWGGASAEILAQIGSAVASTVSPPAESSKDSIRRYRFKRIINIADLTICDLPHGVQSSSSGLILGDPFFAFCIASVSSPSFVALVPNNPADCNSKAGPAPVELARVGPPPANSLSSGMGSHGRLPMVYDKAAVKSAWISDILLCIELSQRKAVFDDDEGIQQLKGPSSAGSFRLSLRQPTLDKLNRTGAMEATPGYPEKTNSPKEFSVENPVFSPVKSILRTSSYDAATLARRSTIAKSESSDDEQVRIVEKDEF